MNDSSLVGIDLFKGTLRYTCSAHCDAQQSLCLAYDVGVVLISQGDDDVNPILFDCELQVEACKWSPVRMALSSPSSGVTSQPSRPAPPPAPARRLKTTESKSNYIKFYSSTGQLLRQVGPYLWRDHQCHHLGGFIPPHCPGSGCFYLLR